MTTSNWNCPNNHIIDGVYNKLSTQINGEDAWQKGDGIYLRWASMWTQWIFDSFLQIFAEETNICSV